MNNDKCEFCKGTGKEEGQDGCVWCLNTGRKIYQKLMPPPVDQRLAKPVAFVRFRNGEPDYDGDDAVMIMNVPGDTLGDGDSWEPVYTHADSDDVGRLRDSVKALTELSLARLDLICAMRAQLSGLDALLARALPYLSNTPDLVQHGAEDLAIEIRAALERNQ